MAAKRHGDFSMEDSNSESETDREEPAEKIARKYDGAAKYGDGGKQIAFLMAPIIQMIVSNQGGGFEGQTNQSSGFTGWQPQEQQQQQQQLQGGWFGGQRNQSSGFRGGQPQEQQQQQQQQLQGSGDESDARLFGRLGGGVPAKPTGDAVDTETIYKMSRAPRGIAIIINNKNFLRSSGMDRYPRNGTDVDRDTLEKLFNSLKFDVRIYNDITKYEIRRIAKEMASLNHSYYDAFIFSILTHGEEGFLYGTDGTISTREVTSVFKDATTLAGKPKMFFFQACQGHEYMDGMDMADGPQANSSKVSVPAEADFLYAYSTVPGYYSWRNSVNGSWFIQSLTKVFEENAERMDILRMLTRVNAMVSTFKSHTNEYYSDSKRQVSSVVSMLRKELYFFPEKVTEQN